MAITWITPVEVTPGTPNAWIDVDVSGSVPAGATGVILHITTASVQYYGVRKNGSTDDRALNTPYSRLHLWAAIGVDANRILEAYVGNTTDVDIWLVGYFGSDSVFFTNAVDKSLGSTGSWLDIDISADTGGDTAIGAIFEAIGPPATFGFRKNGSSDDRGSLFIWRHVWSVIGVDGSEICEGKISDLSVDFFLVGYIKSDATFNINATDLSLASTGAWTDLTALPGGATGGFIECCEPGYNRSFGLRKNGSSENIYLEMGCQHTWGLVECDASQIIEGEISATDMDFFLVGYATAAAGGGLSIPVAERIYRNRRVN